MAELETAHGRTVLGLEFTTFQGFMCSAPFFGTRVAIWEPPFEHKGGFRTKLGIFVLGFPTKVVICKLMGTDNRQRGPV